jgi:hypothetical protein
VLELEPRDRTALTRRLVDFNYALWDEQVEADVEAGKFDAILDEVCADP